MIIAIPLNNDRIANHFTKAGTLLFIDERGTELSRHTNPALNAGCSGKQDMLELLSDQKATHVIVRNIGERMLGKLLDRQFSVFQARHSHYQAGTPIKPGTEDLLPLTEAGQGRRSLNHAAREKSASCGCTHEKHSTPENGQCCRKQETADHCRQDHGHSHGHCSGQGKRRCCDS